VVARVACLKLRAVKRILYGGIEARPHSLLQATAVTEVTGDEGRFAYYGSGS
jgi:hypothetical protein